MKRYTATVVDLIPGLSDEDRAADASEYAADTIHDAERGAISGSAVNCHRRVYVEDTTTMAVVKGPYILRATKSS